MQAILSRARQYREEVRVGVPSLSECPCDVRKFLGVAVAQARADGSGECVHQLVVWLRLATLYDTMRNIGKLPSTYGVLVEHDGSGLLAQELESVSVLRVPAGRARPRQQAQGAPAGGEVDVVEQVVVADDVTRGSARGLQPREPCYRLRGPCRRPHDPCRRFHDHCCRLHGPCRHACCRQPPAGCTAARARAARRTSRPQGVTGTDGQEEGSQSTATPPRAARGRRQ
eukprot:scaffold274561_cov31-Tisochrysis_lutea.AAC.5